MFVRLNAMVVAIALALPMVIASPTPALEARTDGCAKDAHLECCNSYHAADSTTSGLLGLLNVVAPIGTLLGVHCNPINVIGLGGNSCQQQTACCTGNNMNGLVVVGCSPVGVQV